MVLTETHRKKAKAALDRLSRIAAARNSRKALWDAKSAIEQTLNANLSKETRQKLINELRWTIKVLEMED